MDESVPIHSYFAPPVAAAVEGLSRPPVMPVSRHLYGRRRREDLDEPSWINSVRKELNDTRPESYPRRPWTIFRVSDSIRRGGDRKAYEPLVVPIGAYHHSRSTRTAMQDHKWQCVRYLLSRHRNRERAGELLNRCLSELKALDTEIRSCYSDNLYQDQHRLALVMLLDGCFIIHLLLKQVEKDEVEEEEEEEEKEKEEVVVVIEEGMIDVEKGKEVIEEGMIDVEKGKDEIVELEIGEEDEKIQNPLLGMLWIWNIIAYDLLKLENQIPFFVVQTLFHILATPGDKGLDLPKLALRLFHDIHPNKSRGFTAMPASQVHHLLHLFHSSLVPSQPQPSDSRAYAKYPPEWIPSATELKRGGIRFRKKDGSGSFLDVSFKDGVIEIPPLRVYDYTNSLFRNLVAFEQCYPDTSTCITVYTAFMDCIVDTAEDAKLLDLKGILANRLSTDAAVADLFDQICVPTRYASDRNYLADLFFQVTEYRESKWRRWRAQLSRDYFRSPWASVAVVAAVLLFLLTIEQSVFAAMSYFFP
ncbi:UPF0481 protein-like [Iris pallida]|uniref:UPF0481 protein-like n=1 Tax=Iris pallida TaxID=29817 RepID=A0AAX6DTG6_IRIPA|nr:UPF0481 protein-like [Iris pallida]